jgi:hypothetical protein
MKNNSKGFRVQPQRKGRSQREADDCEALLQVEEAI